MTKPQIYRLPKASRWGLSGLAVDRPVDRQRSRIRPLEPPVDRRGRPKRTESTALSSGRQGRQTGHLPGQGVHVRARRSTVPVGRLQT